MNYHVYAITKRVEFQQRRRRILNAFHKGDYAKTAEYKARLFKDEKVVSEVLDYYFDKCEFSYNPIVKKILRLDQTIHTYHKLSEDKPLSFINIRTGLKTKCNFCKCITEVNSKLLTEHIYSLFAQAITFGKSIQLPGFGTLRLKFDQREVDDYVKNASLLESRHTLIPKPKYFFEPEPYFEKVYKYIARYYRLTSNFGIHNDEDYEAITSFKKGKFLSPEVNNAISNVRNLELLQKIVMKHIKYLMTFEKVKTRNKFSKKMLMFYFDLTEYQYYNVTLFYLKRHYNKLSKKTRLDSIRVNRAQALIRDYENRILKLETQNLEQIIAEKKEQNNDF